MWPPQWGRPEPPLGNFSRPIRISTSLLPRVDQPGRGLGHPGSGEKGRNLCDRLRQQRGVSGNDGNERGGRPDCAESLRYGISGRRKGLGTVKRTGRQRKTDQYRNYHCHKGEHVSGRVPENPVFIRLGASKGRKSAPYR